MKPIDFIWVFIGSGFGGSLRFLLGNVIGRTERFPLSTFVINILACLIAGFLVSRIGFNSLRTMDLRLLLITGFCGGFSTFSAFGIETFDLMQKGFWFSASVYVASSIFAGLIGIWLGGRLNF